MNKAALVIRIPDDMPLLVIFLTLVLSALVSFFIVKAMVRRTAIKTEKAISGGEIAQGGIIANTYSKYGFIRTGQILIDDQKIVLKNKHSVVTHEVNRANVTGAYYKDSGLENFYLKIDVKGVEPIELYTMRPTVAHQNIAKIIQILRANKI